MYTATASAKAGHMSKVLLAAFAFAVVCSIAPTAWALDRMGPPVAGLEQGQFKFGVDFSFSEMDLEADNGQWAEFLDGVFWDAGEATSFTLKDFEANKTSVNFGYGFADNVEGFIRVGGARSEFGDSIWLDSEQFESGSNMAVGGGLKATFFDQDGLRLGAIIQTGYAEYHGELDAPHWAAADYVELDVLDVQLALGASYTWADHFSIYGGPFLHFISGDLYDNISELFVDQFGVPQANLLNSEYVWELDEDSVLGGYLGAQLEIGEGCAVNFEYLKTAAADAFGASIMWRF